jgi:hypothetical protein
MKAVSERRPLALPAPMSPETHMQGTQHMLPSRLREEVACLASADVAQERRVLLRLQSGNGAHSPPLRAPCA